MKKIIAVLLCMFMLAGVMSVATFAGDFPNPWELEDFGQKNWTLYITSGEAPVVDGKVNEGEYALVIEDLEAANDIDDDRFFNVDHPGAMVVDIYMDYDGDYLYVGVVVDDHEMVSGEGLHGIDGRMTLTIGGDKEKIHNDDMLTVSLNPESVSAGNADEVMVITEGNVTTYEFTIDRYTILDKYGFDELEQVYLRYVIADETNASFENSALWNEMWFGFSSGELKEIYPTGGAARYPHVVYFINEEAPTEAPETEAPVTEAPVTEAPVTDAPATDAPVDTPAEGGCGASVAAMGVALVAALGTCTAFISKRR